MLSTSQPDCSGPEQSRLGTILVANGYITRAQLEDALHRQRETKRLLGEELIHAGHATAEQINHGLWLQRKLIACALAVAVGVAPLGGLVSMVNAGQLAAAMPVSAVVLPQAKIHIVAQPAQLKITEADVSRGSVEVSAGSRFSVTTNTAVLVKNI